MLSTATRALGSLQRTLSAQRIEPSLCACEAGNGAASMVGGGDRVNQLHLGRAQGLEGGEGYQRVGDDHVLVRGAVVKVKGGTGDPVIHIVVLQGQAERMTRVRLEGGQVLRLEDLHWVAVSRHIGVDLAAGSVAIEQRRQGGVVRRCQDAGEAGRKLVNLLVSAQQIEEVIWVGLSNAG